MTTVLVVDDDHAIVETMCHALEDEGYHVVTAVGAQAIEAARAHQPAVILLDLQMPGMDGAEVSRQLRGDPRTADSRIVMMSAVHSIRLLATELPVDDLLPKPFELTDLYAMIDKFATSSSIRPRLTVKQ